MMMLFICWNLEWKERSFHHLKKRHRSINCGTWIWGEAASTCTKFKVCKLIKKKKSFVSWHYSSIQHSVCKGSRFRIQNTDSTDPFFLAQFAVSLFYCSYIWLFCLLSSRTSLGKRDSVWTENTYSEFPLLAEEQIRHLTCFRPPL